MKRIVKWPLVILGVGLVILTTLLVKPKNRDLSNYTVSTDVTQRVMALFDELGANDHQLGFGGSTRSVAVGETGFGQAMQFALSDRKGMLGIHRLRDRTGEAIRFSFPEDMSPFHTTELSASFAENEQLRASFHSLLRRLELNDPYHHTWFVLQGTEGDEAARVEAYDRACQAAGGTRLGDE